MVAAAAAAVVARHLCSDDGDGATTKGPKRVRPRPRPSTAAPLFSPGGCCCGGGGGRGGAARSWRRRPPLAVPCSLPRSVVVLPPLQHELVAAADSLAVVLPALQHELVPAHDSGCWPTPMLIRAAALPCSARPLPATTSQPSSRPGPPALQLAPSRAERAKGDGDLRRASGAVLCRASCAEQTDPDGRDDGIERAAGGRRERGPPCRGPVTAEAAGSRSPACLSNCCPSLSCLESAALLLANQQSARPSPSQPASSLTTLRATSARLDSLPCHVPCGGGQACPTRRRGQARGKGKDRCCCRSDSGSGGWLLRCAAGRRSRNGGSPRRRKHRAGTGGARGRKKRKKEQRVGGALFCAGPPATRGPPSAEQEPMGSTLRSRRGAGCCPSFLHSAQMTAAEPCASPCLPPLSAWATAR